MRPNTLLVTLALVLGPLSGPACTEPNPLYVKAGSDGVIVVPGDLGDGPIPGDVTSPGCPPGTTRCGADCVNLKTDPNHCGKCDQRCGTGTSCLQGLCCPKGWENCGGTCADLTVNTFHCGTCNKKCKDGETCVAGKCQEGSGCADGKDEQVFQKGMRGCSGTVPYISRASLCATGYRPCKAQEWVDNRGGSTPQFHYWTDENLRYNGSEWDCYVSTSKGSQCGYGQTPMRVCASTSSGFDALNNRCNWRNCGFESAKPNQYFGGCQGNITAGTLCCPQ